MKILLLGKDGQVGWELQRSLAPLGELHACGRAEADLADTDALRRLVQGHRPDVIVNAAAYTAVDKAESDAERAAAVNAIAPGVLAQEARRTGALLVHYSTDYVFDGLAKRAYREDDATAPASVYGRTKLDGERAIAASGARHLVFRTSWVYAARGGNFAKTMLRLAAERDTLRVVADQIGAPTSAELIADITALCLYRQLWSEPTAATYGTYHLAADGATSWCDYARFLVTQAAMRGARLKARAEDIAAISTVDYPTPAQRPANSLLDTGKLSQTFEVRLPDWNVHVERLVAELIPLEHS